MRPDTRDHRCVSLHHRRESHLKLGFGVPWSFHDVMGLLTPGHKVLVLFNIGHHIIHFLHWKPMTARSPRLTQEQHLRDEAVTCHLKSNYPSILRSEYSFLLLVRLMKFLLWGTAVIVSQSWRQSTFGVLVIKMPHDDKCLKGKRHRPVSQILETCHRQSPQHRGPLHSSLQLQTQWAHKELWNTSW